jgi:hypothetical protein
VLLCHATGGGWPIARNLRDLFRRGVAMVVMGQRGFAHNRVRYRRVHCPEAVRMRLGVGRAEVRGGRESPSGHGGAGESPKNQHHHQDDVEAATHRRMIKLWERRFPGDRWRQRWQLSSGLNVPRPQKAAHTAM